MSGKSRNIVLAKLKDFEELQKSEASKEEAKKVDEDDIIVDDEKTSIEKVLPKICEYQSLAPFCLSKKPQMIVPILPREKKDKD